MDSYIPSIFVIFVVTSGIIYSASADTTSLNNALNITDNKAGEEAHRKANDMIHATLPFVLRSAGFIECQGADSETAGNFFGQILGNDINYTRSDYLCGPTCRGRCIPRPHDVGIPKDNLPYGCLCSNHGCDLNGPMVILYNIDLLQGQVCLTSFNCRLANKKETAFRSSGQFNGYSCQWINTISGLPVTFTEKSVMLPGAIGRPPVLLPAKNSNRFSPIKWCSCCPRFPLTKNPH